MRYGHRRHGFSHAKLWHVVYASYPYWQQYSIFHALNRIKGVRLLLQVGASQT